MTAARIETLRDFMRWGSLGMVCETFAAYLWTFGDRDDHVWNANECGARDSDPSIVVPGEASVRHRIIL